MADDSAKAVEREFAPEPGPETSGSDGLGVIPDQRTSNSVRTIVFLAREFERACRETGISLPQFRLLLFLRDGPQRAGELAARVAIKRPTLTALVTGLERDGHLSRAAVEKDGRGIHIGLTEKGARAVERANRRLADRLEALIDLGDARARDAVLDVLDDLARTMDSEILKRVR